MLKINDISYDSDNIIVKEPKKIYSFTTILIITLVIFLLISILFKYYKNKSYIGIVSYDNFLYSVEIIVSAKDLKNLDNYKLLIDNEEYDYEIVAINKHDYDNFYTIVLSIDYNLEEFLNDYLIVNLKSEKTTIFKTITRIIKEEFTW